MIMKAAMCVTLLNGVMTLLTTFTDFLARLGVRSISLSVSQR